MKNVAVKFSLVLTVLALLLALCSVFFAPADIAHADSAIDVIKAPVSNLEGNATAGKSTVKLIVDATNAIYIPESYYIQYLSVYKNDMHKVSYAGKDFYIKGEPTITQITVAENENIYPDVTLTLKDDEPVQIGYLDEITSDHTIKFLGYSEDNTEIYVSATLNDDVLYSFIPADSVNDFAVPYQSRTQTERDELLASKEEPPILNGGKITPNTSVALRVVMIIGIAIPSLLIVILLFKPSKNERRYSKNSVRSSRGRDEFDYDDSRSYHRRDRDDRDYSDRDYDDRYDRRDDRDYDRRRDYDERDRYPRDYDRRDDDR